MTPSRSQFKAACVQFCATRSADRNVATMRRLVGDAARGGAQLVLTPEQTGMIEMDGKVLMANARTEADDPALAALAGLALEHRIWLSIGSLAIRLADDRLANRSFLISPAGEVVARFDKIHMFDVSLPNGESYRESNRYAPGDRAVCADLPWGRIGLTVCYDLRFPALYLALAQAGADFLTVPSAFTRPTGEAHWHVLLRARAIETGCFVLAAAQDGEHEAGRKTYGRSLIVDPWGEVLADAGTGEGVVFADIDPARVETARSRIPALDHDRRFAAPDAAAERMFAS
ncbi:MAG: carbon-nitrogen hydrolase family protein [Hyphomicrobiales bacterium]